MILSFSILVLWIFYAAGGFSKIIKAANMEPEPTPEPIQAPPMQPEPITPEPVTVEPQPKPTPEPMPEPKQEPTPEPEKIDREKLERVARSCLAASGCTFNLYYYVRYKSDIELMDIIKDFNLKYNFE